MAKPNATPSLPGTCRNRSRPPSISGRHATKLRTPRSHDREFHAVNTPASALSATVPTMRRRRVSTTGGWRFDRYPSTTRWLWRSHRFSTDPRTTRPDCPKWPLLSSARTAAMRQAFGANVTVLASETTTSWASLGCEPCCGELDWALMMTVPKSPVACASMAVPSRGPLS